MQNKLTDSTTLLRNGRFRFSFSDPVPLDGSYAVTVASQPAGQNCSVGIATVVCSDLVYTIWEPSPA